MLRFSIGFFAACACLGPTLVLANGKLLLKATENDRPVPFRLHLRSEKQVPVRVPPLPFWTDHLAVPGSVQLNLPNGNFFFEIERGPEYHDVRGYFTIGNGADDEKLVPLTRACDMAKEGWRSGDLDARRTPKEIEQAMLADDVRFVPLITWSNRKSEWTKTKFPDRPMTTCDDAGRIYDLTAGADDRPGGPIHLFRLPQPAPLPAKPTQLLTLIPALDELKLNHPSLWIDVAHPAAWDLPVLAAAGLVDSYCIAPAQLQRDKTDFTPLGRPLDRGEYPGTSGLGDFAQDVYFHLLNCGLRIAPSAGSGSGLSPNAVGYNRVYVWNDPSSFTADEWWDGLKQGRAVVTNGPLIRPKADGRLPGHVFTGTSGEPVTLHISMDLTTRDTINYVEVIQNGKVIYNVALRDWAADGGRFPPVVFHESGWCLVRARCDHPKACRFTLSAPWYVSISDSRRGSRASAQFFLDWVEARAAMLKIADPEEKRIADEQLDLARAFWRRKIDTATAP